MHRFTPFVLLGALLGCQTILGLDEGKKRPEGQGGTTSASNSSSASSSAGSGGQGGTGTSGTAGAATGGTSTGGAGGAGTGGAAMGGAGTGGSGGGSTGTGGMSTSSSSSTGGGGSDGGVLELDLIDDMEAGGGFILNKSGRVGPWFSYNDMSRGNQMPMPGPSFLSEWITQQNPGNPSSTYAKHTTGSGFSIWGSGIGFDLNNNFSKLVYDISPYKGITFWALANNVNFRVGVAIMDTVATLEGGSCTTSCGDSFGFLIVASGIWEQYFVPFDTMMQEGWGMDVSFDPQTALSIQFSVGVNASYDIWIDDVSFYK